jgi:hypothetical protein
MKKAELKQGVAYFVSTRSNYGSYGHSVYKIANYYNQDNRYYVVFEQDGKTPMSYHRSPSNIYMTRCKTYGADCPTHRPQEGGASVACPRTYYRLMDIREEYWTVVKRARENYLKQNQGKDIRAARLARIAKRNKESQEAPIIKEFYSVLQQVTGERHTSWDRLGGFNITQMQAITNALKASMPSVQAVA